MTENKTENSNYVQTGWYSVKLNKAYKEEEKYSLIDKIKLLFGYDYRKRNWHKVWSMPMKRNIYYEFADKIDVAKGELIYYKNDLGDEKAEVIYQEDIEKTNIEWANMMKKGRNDITYY